MVKKTPDKQGFDELTQEMQDKLKEVAKDKNIHHHEAYEEAINASPSLPAPDACHRYIEDHHASK